MTSLFGPSLQSFIVDAEEEPPQAARADVQMHDVTQEAHIAAGRSASGPAFGFQGAIGWPWLFMVGHRRPQSAMVGHGGP